MDTRTVQSLLINKIGLIDVLVNMGKITLVLGASPDPNRYSNLAVKRLVSLGIPVIAVGKRKGIIAGVGIEPHQPQHNDIQTVTLYMNADVQKQYIEYILSLRPERIIFNPGTEHPEFEKTAADKGIEVVRGCTLVMLSAGTY
jgi:uncharacterized protein